ncbi:leucine-rich repeat-containing protein 74B-like [Saccostrea echinata]|uniref:leucine-rich repeat-containing protein 74B-like n=1 Tax=Saccostrea echinata TaxID=191078 RepID=UPI002A7EEC59|nr:leucine-rich repeat-containing protein 74B-like [Saccostrea echinata]
MERKGCRLFRSDTAYLLYLHQQKNQPNKEELEKKTEKERRIQTYEEDCHQNGVSCLSRFSRQIGTSDIDMSNACLNSLELLTILNTVKSDHKVGHLDLSGSTMCVKSYKHLCKFLRNNRSLSILKLRNCFIQGEILHALTASLQTSKVEFLDLGNNGVNDSDCETLSKLLTTKTLKELYLSHNRLETRNLRHVGISLAKSRLEMLDLSWNRIRFTGAIEIARGISRNTNLRRLNLSWNGFGFEGCVALSEMLEANNVLTELDLTNNRIHPPALIALIRGITRNSALKVLNLSMNPIPVSYTCFLLGSVLKNSSIQELILKRIVVNDDFLDIVRSVQKTRHVHVEYERCLSVPSLDQQTMSEEVRAPWLFNLDPLNLLFMLKEKNRAQDFFNKINRDGDDVLSYQEFRELFKKAGIPVSQLVLDKIIDFLDKNKDGNIDLSEFLDGDKRIKKITRGQAKETARRESYTKYSRSFRKARIDSQTYRLDIENSQ